MNIPKSYVTFKVATLRHTKDGEPKVTNFTIDEFVRRVATAPISATRYNDYHFQKSEQKRLLADARAAKEANDFDLARALKAQAKICADAIDAAKSGPALQPYIFREDITFKVDNGYPQRDSSRITHFSLIMLDVESKTSKEELHAVLREYEYVLWPTITHRPDDPRYRIVLFPEHPLSISEALALIHRIDAKLPPRNDLSKKLQNLDPTCPDKGRMMFLPKWLSSHPEPYSIVHNLGQLVTSASFALTVEERAAHDARRHAADERQSKVTAENIAIQKHAAGNGAPTVITVNGEDWLHPDALFETKDGYVRLGDVTVKISGVVCPFHADTIGSEFISPNKYSGRPQLVCAKCGTYKMAHMQRSDSVNESHDADIAAFAALVNKARSKRPRLVPQKIADPSKPLIEYSAPPIVHYFSQEFLPDLTNLLPERGLLFVRSPKGTGKTQSLHNLVKGAKDAGKSVLVLTHRRALATNLAERLNISNYQTLEGGTLTKFCVVCVNSLTSRLQEDSASYDIVIVDESEQVLRNLLAKTLEYHLSNIFNKILLLLRNAQRVICLDADMSSDLTIDVIAKMRDPELTSEADEYLGIINTYKIGVGKSIRCLPTRYQLLGEIYRSANEGKKLFIACSSARAAMVIGAIFAADQRRVLTITSDTSAEPAVMEFQSAPNKCVEEYDIVVASPSLQTGFSIDKDHFDKIYGWFQSVEGITFQDYDQALSRVRKCHDVTVWMEPTRRAMNIDPPEIFVQQAISREMATRKLLPMESRALSDGERLWVGIEGKIKYLTAIWSHHRDIQFKSMKEDLGFRIDNVDLNETDQESGKLMWQSFKDVGPDLPALIFAAKELDDDDFLELQRQNHKSKEDHFALRRYRFAKAIDAELTQYLVAKAIEEDLLKTVARIRSLVIDGDSTRKQYDIADRERQNSAFTKAAHRTREHELLVSHLCKAVNIDIKSYYARLSAGETIEIPVSLMDQLVDAFTQRQKDFRHYFKLRITPVDKAVAAAKQIADTDWTAELEAQTVEKAKQKCRKRVWDGTLGKLGLPLTKKKRGPRDNQVACYFIDPATVDLTIKGIKEEQRIHDKLSPLLLKTRTRSLQRTRDEA